MVTCSSLEKREREEGLRGITLKMETTRTRKKIWFRYF